MVQPDRGLYIRECMVATCTAGKVALFTGKIFVVHCSTTKTIAPRKLPLYSRLELSHDLLLY